MSGRKTLRVELDLDVPAMLNGDDLLEHLRRNLFEVADARLLTGSVGTTSMGEAPRR